ncbi:hypothetical protein TNCV_2992261 [Trichonephila clavipes]|nr:hypothetical protein TNCV_2992261 [Trichonephila clavipes]
MAGITHAQSVEEERVEADRRARSYSGMTSRCVLMWSPMGMRTVYDGSRSNTGRAGGCIFSNTPGNEVKVRNSDHCSVFRSEFIVISGALDHALNFNKDSI